VGLVDTAFVHERGHTWKRRIKEKKQASLEGVGTVTIPHSNGIPYPIEEKKG